MKLINDKILLSFSDLYKSGISEGSIKSARFRKTKGWTFIKDPDDKRKILVSYDDLKLKYKEKINRILCKGKTPYYIINIQTLNDHLIIKEEDQEFFLSFPGITPIGRMRGMEACKYLYFISRFRTPTKRKKQFSGMNSPEFWSMLLTHIRNNDVLQQNQHHGVNFPNRREHLQSLARRYEQEGPQCLISQRLDNKNSRKLGRRYLNGKLQPYNIEVKQRQIAVLAELAAHPNNFGFTTITDLYNEIGQKAGWPTLSNRRIEDIIISGEIQNIISGGRYGSKYFYNEIAMQQKRRRPSAPLIYVTTDGWEVELSYQKRVYNTKGETKMVYDQRMVVTVILDPYNNYPLGYAIQEHENTDLNKRAMKNAVDHIHELTGKLAIPHQIQSDNYGRKIMRPFYQAASQAYTPAAVGNAKSKVIEPYFYYLNRNYCKLMDNWSGYGITSRKENQPNREFKNKIKKSFPDREGVIRQIEWIIEREREKKRDKYIKHINIDNLIEIDERRYLQIFGIKHPRTARLRGPGLMITINGAKYTYDTFDKHFRDLRHLDWQPYYNPDNPEKILVSANDGREEFILTRKYEQPMAIIEQTETDREKLKEVRNFNKALKEDITQARKENYTLIEDLIYDHPELQDMRKLLLFSNNGQQKNEIYEAKALISKKIEKDRPISEPIPVLPPIDDDEMTDEEIERGHMRIMEKKFQEFQDSLKDENKDKDYYNDL